MTKGLPPLLLLGLYFALALAPVALAAARGLPPRPFLDELSSALAMIAFAVLLMEFVLSGRFRFISGRMGIDVTMRFHQLMARTLTLFLVIHPFLYTTPLGHPRPWDPGGRLTLGLTPAAGATGLFAWLLLLILVITAIARDRLPYRYETWRLSHGLGALLVAGFGLHHALEAGRYSSGVLMTWFWSVLAALALLTLVYVYLLAPLVQRRNPYRVTDLRPAAERIWALTLEPEHPGPGRGGFAFAAGQFVWLKLTGRAFTLVEHPFSIASAPQELPTLRFLIKEAGDSTGAIGQVPRGRRAYLHGPHGNFTLRGRDGRGFAFIAGGVGIAAILSLLRDLRACGDRRPMVLIYGNRSAAQIAHRDELAALAQALDLKVHLVIAEPPPDWGGPVGILDGAMLRGLLGTPAPADWLYFVGGPAVMIDSVEESLGRLGVPLRQVVSEKFSYD